ncbi:MAG: protease complex subunit PrcB family protein [candidate division WOR-3 bacterium]
MTSFLTLFVFSNAGPPGVEKVSFSVVLAGPTCKAERETVIVCRNNDELIKAISDFGISEKMNIMPDFPDVILVMAFLGKRPTAGYAIEPIAIYSVFYNEAGVDGNSIWDWEVKPLLAQDGLDSAAVSVYPIKDNGDAVLVAREKCPPKGSMLAQVITSPYVIIEVPRDKVRTIGLSLIKCKK